MVQTCLNLFKLWDHTQLSLVKDKAMHRSVHLCVMVVFDWKVREVWEVKEVFGVTGGLENCFAIDELWDHIQLRAVKEKAMVVCR